MTESTENNQLLHTVMQAVSSGITVMKSIYNHEGKVEDFSILLLNPYIIKWTGETDYVDRRYNEVFAKVSDNEMLEKFKMVAETGESAKFEILFESKELNRWLRFTAVKQEDFLVVTTEDLSERKQAESDLKQSLEAAEKQKRLYDSITNNTPDLVYVFDLSYRFTYANKALLAMWGKSAEDAIGRGLRENGYEEWHAQMHEREIDAIIANKERIRGTVSFPHAELGSRVYDYILTPVIGDNGDVEAIAGTTRDITDLKNIEQSLQESENRLRNMIEQAPIAIALTRGEEGIFENINPLMLALIGKENKDVVLGKAASELIPQWYDQSLESILQQVIKTKQAFRMNDVAVDFRVDGVLKTGYFNLSYTHISDAENASSVLHMALDVTDQVLARRKIEESEAKLMSVIDQTPAPTLVLRGDDLIIEQINIPMLEMIGRGKEIIGMPLLSVLPELDGQYVWEQVLKVYTEGIDFDQKEVCVPHNRAGVIQDFYYNLAYRPIRENGEITGMIQVAIEVTNHVLARKKLEESESRYRTLTETLERQVIERTRELQRSNDDLQQFAHVASHDLKEPVRKIKMFSSRLEEQLKDQLDETAERFIGKIHSATDRMYTMIEGVLVYSTMSGVMQEPHPTDLNEVIKSIETDLEVPLEKSGGTIIFQDLPIVDGAPVLLYQLFYNLISNSIKFAKSGTPIQINIASEIIVANNKKSTRITLQDNGIGFEPDQGIRIFDTFTRLNSKDIYEGTGLGLSLCKKIVERHGGTISASGSPDNGATFVVMLPLSQSEFGI